MHHFFEILVEIKNQSTGDGNEYTAKNAGSIWFLINGLIDDSAGY